ncbi:E3 SUMO-protein ligase ZBED1-like [Paramacrobiotus metropolitanus]|uniref:E3 SUMO-protein ligase ZBED1-like n=1 Tax=Paramacrobiotus metropolitanus TaxID=2943436 RepID=UPI0024462EF7|nr:E3 SUMO-protein ligase ZBED1-like [Paramacrobiotus metropolitanus]
MASASQESAGGSEVLRGRKQSSSVWNYFTYDSTARRAVCNAAECKFAQSGRITSNLRTHLSRKHLDQYNALLEAEKKADSAAGKKTSTAKRVSKWSNDAESQASATNALAAFIACTPTSVNAVQHRMFSTFCARLRSDYVVPGRTKITDTMDELYAVMKAKVGSALQNGGLITICADIWTKKGMTESFLGVTAHFLSPEWEHKAVTLAVRSLRRPHTASRIKAMVYQIIEEWKIPRDRFFIIVTDNGANMTAGFKEVSLDLIDEEDSEAVAEANQECEALATTAVLNASMDEEALSESVEQGLATSEPSTPADPDAVIREEMQDYDAQEADHDATFDEIQRIPCFNHLLQCVVRSFDTVKECRDIIKKAKKLVSKFNHSNTATAALVDRSGKKLLGDVETRWNSTYIMLKRLCELKDDVDHVCEQNGWDSFLPQEWSTIDALRKFLEPFDTYTSISSGQDYTTNDMYVAILLELDKHCRASFQSRKTMVSVAAHVVVAALDQRFARFLDPNNTKHNPFYLAGCFLNPFLWRLLTNEQVDSAVKFVKATYGKYFPSEISPGPSTDEQQPSPKRARFANLSDKLGDLRTHMVAERSRSTLENEIGRYKAASYPEFTEQSDAVRFWKSSHGKGFEKLSKIAAAVLGGVATSTSTEQLFSVSGFQTVGRRNRLGGHRLEVETLLNKNLSFYENSV